MSVLSELQSAVESVGGQVGPAVVGIGHGWGLGTGVVVGRGLVVTNAHNLRGAETTVSFADGRTETGQVRGFDVDGDLAVVAVETGDVEPAEWGDGAELRPGAPVFALANPGGRGVRVTFGLVSGVGRAFRGPRGRRITGSIEHTAPLPRGSSGGPLVGADGRLLGLNTNRLGEGFYAALPADADLRARVDRLGRGESPSRARLGVGIAPGREARRLRRAVGLPDRDGLLVRVVEDDSPAARAGIRTGDLIVAAGGRELGSVDDLFEALDALDAGAPLPLTVVRGAEELAISVTFAEGAATQEGTA
jgi:S1-C subfamily serine protease